MLIDKYLDDIFSSGLDVIKIAIDGLDKETHEKYRVGSDIEHIKRNVVTLSEERKRRGGMKPRITIQTLVNKYNQEKLGDIKAFADQYADRYIYKKMFLGKTESVRERNIHFATDLEEFKRDRVNPKLYLKNMPYCHHLKYLAILSDGEVTQCCFDYEGEGSFGNLIKEPYQKILRSSERKEFVKTYFARTNPVCRKCDLIIDITKKG